MSRSYAKEWDTRILTMIRLKRMIKSKTKTVKEFSAQVGMAPPEVSRVLSGYVRLNPVQFADWAKALDLSQKVLRFYLEGS